MNIFRCSSLKIDSLKKKFDLIILGFVLYVLDRKDILDQFSLIYKSLNKNGHLVIQDFDCNVPHYNNYRNFKNIYVYKTNYSKILKSSNLFHLVKKNYYKPAKDNFKYKHNKRSVALYKKIDFEKNYPKNLF